MSHYNGYPGNRNKDVQNQTVNEWKRPNDNAVKYRQASNTPVSRRQRPSESPQNEDTLTGGFQYVGHRTTTLGRLVLDFMHEDTGVIVSWFFNVDICSTRTGQKYRVGEGGQFTTRKNHRFRRFWMYIIGEPPYRWSRVHTELHKLKNVSFIGIAELRHPATGRYWNLRDLRKRR